MQIEMRHLLRNLGITSIFVTHDQEEALVMSDRVAVMNDGRIEHLGTPAEVYARPRTLYVMEFVGQSTRIGGRIAAAGDGLLSIDTALGRIAARAAGTLGASVFVGVRPEAILLGEGPEAEFNNLRAKAADIVFLGSKTTLLLAGPAPEDRLMVELARLPQPLEPGGDVAIRWRIEDTLVFPVQ
jgi:putative spermidine/putrescine transport system ATP-binding protein